MNTVDSNQFGEHTAKKVVDFRMLSGIRLKFYLPYQQHTHQKWVIQFLLYMYFIDNIDEIPISCETVTDFDENRRTIESCQVSMQYKCHDNISFICYHCCCNYLCDLLLGVGRGRGTYWELYLQSNLYLKSKVKENLNEKLSLISQGR